MIEKLPARLVKEFKTLVNRFVKSRSKTNLLVRNGTFLSLKSLNLLNMNVKLDWYNSELNITFDKFSLSNIPKKYIKDNKKRDEITKAEPYPILNT